MLPWLFKDLIPIALHVDLPVPVSGMDRITAILVHDSVIEPAENEEGAASYGYGQQDRQGSARVSAEIP